jgi:hypothetical protein
MDKKTIAIILIVFMVGVGFGGIVRRGYYSRQLSALEEGLIYSQRRVEELVVANRDLADRQQRAVELVARTASNLATAGATVQRIDELIERIIATVEELERIYRLLGNAE